MSFHEDLIAAISANNAFNIFIRFTSFSSCAMTMADDI